MYDMILAIFLFSFFSYYYQCLAAFDPVLQSLSINSDLLIIIAMFIALISAICLFIKTKNKANTLRRVLSTMVVWLPWLIYLTLRWYPDYPYSSRKLFLMVFAQFGSILILCLSYHYDSKKFVKYFYISTISMIALLLIYFFFSHIDYTVVHKINTSDIAERFSVYGTNPIIIARSFAIGALCIILWAPYSYTIRTALCIPLIIGVYMTGSRGPALSLIIVFICHYLWSQGISKNYLIRLFGVFMLLTIVSIAVFIYNKDAIESYLSRGQRNVSVYEASGRKAIYILGWNKFISNPVFGVGLGRFSNFETIHQNKGHDSIIIKTKQSYPHNIIIEVLAELGIIGILLFILLLRPGIWMLNYENKFIFLFFLCFLFAMTSGDFFGNALLFIFYYLAWFNRKPQQADTALSP